MSRCWKTMSNRTMRIKLTRMRIRRDPLCPLWGFAGGSEERIGGSLKELRPDPRRQGSGRTLHAFGGDSLLMFADGGHHCGTGLSEVSGSLSFSPSFLHCLQRGASRRRTGVRQSFYLLSFPLVFSSSPILRFENGSDFGGDASEVQVLGQGL